MNEQPLLTIEHLSISCRHYERGLRQRLTRPIEDLSLCLSSGEILGVMGASGAGKSLLAQAILGILPDNAQASGVLRYAGQLLTPQRAAELRGRELALIPQSVSCLDPLLTIGRQLCQGDHSPAARSRCLQVLAELGLEPEVARLYPFQLSGGMARRVLLATALMGQPRLIIADEPTPGLHPAASGLVLSQLRRLAKQGAAVLLISHDLTAVLSAAQRVIVLYQGRDVEEAPAATFTTPAVLRHPYTRALLAAQPEQGLPAPDSAAAAGGQEDRSCC